MTNKVSSNPMVQFGFEKFDAGWEAAITAVLEVAQDMISEGKFDDATLDELSQRIV
jgi:hypothetical protein